MSCEVHVLAGLEAEMIGYTIRHYQTFATKIVVHVCTQSNDGTRDVAESYGVDVRPWDTAGKLNDGMAAILKNTCWLGTPAEWVVCVDCDELLYFPTGAEVALASYTRTGAAVIKPCGFEMFSDTFPTTNGQIYDEVKMGARDDKWYAKPVLFSPRKVLESGFGIGAHESRPILKNGRSLYIGSDWPNPSPPCYLLHFHQIGPAERIAARYDATRLRLSALNERHRWGNFAPGIQHVQQKRDYIIPRLERVVP